MRMAKSLFLYVLHAAGLQHSTALLNRQTDDGTQSDGKIIILIKVKVIKFSY